MSERCSCGQPTKGSVGMLRLCYDCAARIFDQSKRRLRGRFVFMLKNEDTELGLREWIPDAAISRERARLRDNRSSD